MLEKDNAEQAVKSEVESCKKSVTLDYDSTPKFTGHESADYGSGPSQEAAGGSKGTSK